MNYFTSNQNLFQGHSADSTCSGTNIYI